MKARTWIWILLPLLAGCRMYGGSERSDFLLEKIQEASLAVEADHARVRSETGALRRAAQEIDALLPFADRLAAHMVRLGAVVEEHQAFAVEAEDANTGILRRNILSSWVGTDRYRRLHRIYGAMISDRQVMSDRYDAVLLDLRAELGMPWEHAVREEGRYQIAPQFYARIERSAAHLGLTDILATMGEN